MSASFDDELELVAEDGHHWRMPARLPERPRAGLLWLPAMGVAARNYLPLAEQLGQHGVAVFVHEWRGLGSSNLRAGHDCDWGYRELLALDIATAARAAREHLEAPGWIAGGHSLGGQFACCHAGVSGLDYDALWLVATGTPHWQTFSGPRRYLLPTLYRFLPWLARRQGALPGRRLGFAGNEARTVVREWAGIGLSNRYHVEGLQTDVEAAMARLQAPVHGVRFRDDWLVPHASLAGLAAKMPRASFRAVALDREQLGTRADHFAWMKQPRAVVEALLDRNPDPPLAAAAS